MDKIASELPLEEYLQSLFKHSSPPAKNTSNKSEIDTAVELATILHNDQKNQTTKDDNTKLKLKNFVRITAKLYQLLLRNEGVEQLLQTYSPIWNWLVNKLNNYEKLKSEMAKLDSDSENDSDTEISTINIPQLLYVTLLICCQLRFLYDKENEEKTTSKFNTAVTIIRKLVKSDAEFASEDYGVISTSDYLSKITKNVKISVESILPIKPGRGRGVFNKKRSDSLAPEIQNTEKSENTKNPPTSNKILQSQKNNSPSKTSRVFRNRKRNDPHSKRKIRQQLQKSLLKSMAQTHRSIPNFPKTINQHL